MKLVDSAQAKPPFQQYTAYRSFLGTWDQAVSMAITAEVGEVRVSGCLKDLDPLGQEKLDL